MKLTSLILAVMISQASGFSPALLVQVQRTTSALAAYVPDGLSEAEYRKIKEQDKKGMGKDLGRLGPRGFKVRFFD